MPLAAFPKCFLDDLCVTGTMSVDQWLDMAARLDVDGYEFYWGFTPWQQVNELKRIRQRVEDVGRTIPMMCYSPDFTVPTVQEQQEEIDRQKRAIEATAILGGQFCRVLSGQRRPALGKEEGIQRAASCIQACLPFAASHGVTLILENHYKDGYWKHPEFAQKMDVFLDLVDAIGEHPHFGINYDPSNAIVAGDDPIVLLQSIVNRVVTMHASDRFLEGGTVEDLRRMEADPQAGYAHILQHGIIGQGMNDYDQIFSILQQAGFKGWISIEDGQDPAVGFEHLQESAKFLRERMAMYDLP